MEIYEIMLVRSCLHNTYIENVTEIFFWKKKQLKQQMTKITYTKIIKNDI